MLPLKWLSAVHSFQLSTWLSDPSGLSEQEHLRRRLQAAARCRPCPSLGSAPGSGSPSLHPAPATCRPQTRPPAALQGATSPFCCHPLGCCKAVHMHVAPVLSCQSSRLPMNMQIVPCSPFSGVGLCLHSTLDSACLKHAQANVSQDASSTVRKLAMMRIFTEL